jgi:hypothetical protein
MVNGRKESGNERNGIRKETSDSSHNLALVKGRGNVCIMSSNMSTVDSHLASESAICLYRRCIGRTLRRAFVFECWRRYLRVTGPLSAYSARLRDTDPRRGLAGASGSPGMTSWKGLSGTLVRGKAKDTTYLLHDELHLVLEEVVRIPRDTHLDDDIDDLLPRDGMIPEWEVQR